MSSEAEAHSMNQEVSIRVRNLGKVYKLFSAPFDRVKETFHPLRRKYHQRFQALSDITLDVRKGETVGVIGRNGSGKSTLLQVICGILQPTTGSVWKEGRIAALLELGAGFNPEFSGRENVYLNGSILGLSRREMDDCFGDILAFADIGEFIDQPVKTYSSGMYVRLAFAVAINVRPDILIVDEALSVGDTLFQAKCFAKFREFQQRGITIIFVTHSIDLITRYCDRACLLDRGVLQAYGPPQEVIDRYNKLMLEYSHRASRVEPVYCNLKRHWAPGRETGDGPFHLNPEENRYGNGKATIEEVGIYSLDGRPAQALMQMEEYEVRLTLVFHERIDSPVIAYIIKDVQGMDITGTNTLYHHVDAGICQPGERLTVSFVQKMTLRGGGYLLSAGCAGYDRGEYVVYERRYDVLPFEVAARRPCVGVVDLDAVISLDRTAGGTGRNEG